MSNLATRTISGVLFVIITVAAIYCGAVSFVVLFAAISAVCVWEFCTLVNSRKGLQVNRMICTVAAVYLFLAVMAFNTAAVGAMIFVPYVLPRGWPAAPPVPRCSKPDSPPPSARSPARSPFHSQGNPIHSSRRPSAAPKSISLKVGWGWITADRSSAVRPF